MTKTSLDPVVLIRAAKILKVLAHPVRLRLVEILSAGRHSVGDLTGRLSREQAVVSKHLAVLKRTGLVD